MIIRGWHLRKQSEDTYAGPDDKLMQIRGGNSMEIGAIIGVVVFILMALFAVFVGIIAAVSTVSGIKKTNDEDDPEA